MRGNLAAVVPIFGAFWVRPGVYFVKANATTLGPTEYLPALKARGYGWVAFNCQTGEWADERLLAQRHGLDVCAWMRVRSRGDLELLQEAAYRWAAKAIIPNIESPDTRDEDLMYRTLLALSHYGKGSVITDGWVDPLGRWQGYKRWVGQVECFPEENPAYSHVPECAAHGNTYFRATVPVLAAYGTRWLGRLPTKADYPSYPVWAVYPGDTVETWAQW